MRFFCALLFFVVVSSAVLKPFEGQSVIKVSSSNSSSTASLLDIIMKENIDVWSPTLNHVRVTQKSRDMLQSMGFETSTIIADLQKAIDDFEADKIHSRENADDFFDAYHPFDEIIIWLEKMAGQFSEIANLERVGQSHENRVIESIVIHGTDQPSDVPAIVFTGGQHAREWISPITTLYIIKELCEGYGNDPVITNLVDSIQWVIIPVANPDGYSYTWNSSSTRLWRKNREPTSNPSCFGVDINRNWPYRWNTGGSSSNPCSDTYHGPSGGSTNEIKALTDMIKSRPNTRGYIDFHAYSQLYMSPWGYSRTYPNDYSAMKTSMDQSVAAIRTVHGKIYRAGSIANIIYVASGGSVDWTYGELGIVYSFGIELRDTGTYGFLLPANQIIPQGEEIMPSVISFAQDILEE